MGSILETNYSTWNLCRIFLGINYLDKLLGINVASVLGVKYLEPMWDLFWSQTIWNQYAIFLGDKLPGINVGSFLETNYPDSIWDNSLI